MSAVSAQLRERVVGSGIPHASSCPVSCAHQFTLADLTSGQSACIVDICADSDPAIARRMFDLGFAPGVQVEMLRRAPMADPVVFRIAGYEIALRRAQARCIQVTPGR